MRCEWTSAIGSTAAFVVASRNKEKQRHMTSNNAASQLKICGSNGLLKRRCNFPFALVSSQFIRLRSVAHLLSDAPTRLKKELDTVLALQADIDNANRAIQAAKIAMEKQDISDDTLGALESLERTHHRLMSKVDTLYASLNVGDKFPELQDINLDFVRTLLLARDLKINIRKRAIGSFFEWDKLDQAVGGAQKTLGKITFELMQSILTFPRYEAPSTNTQGYRQAPTSLDERHPEIQYLLSTA